MPLDGLLRNAQRVPWISFQAVSPSESSRNRPRLSAVSVRGSVTREWNSASYGGVPSSRTSGNSIFRAPEKRRNGSGFSPV